MTMAAGAISPEKQAQLLAVLEQEKPNFHVFDDHEKVKCEAWSNELSMLRRRVETRFEMLELPGGDCIAVRTCLTEAEEDRLGELLNRAFVKGDKDAPYEIIELCTANPCITAQWLKDNPEEFSTQDFLTVLYSYIERKQEIRQEMADRVMKIASFRVKRDGQSSS